MTLSLVNLKDFFTLQFRELYDSRAWENKIVELASENAHHPQLKKMLHHIQNTIQYNKIHLDDIFDQLNLSRKDNSDELGQFISQKSQRLISHCKDTAIRDVVIINSLQRLVHHKISMLGALASYAIEMDAIQWATLLHKQLEEEKKLDQKLSELAEREINKKSLAMQL